MTTKFKKIYIEITNVCNLDCDFCPKTGRPPMFMSPASFSAALDGISGWTEHLYFHVMGEPLLHPDIGELLEISAAHGYKVNLTTNGTLLPRVGTDIIGRPALRQVNISLHSLEANSCGYPTDEYLGGVIEFVRAALDRGRPIISLRLWNGDGKNSLNPHIIRRMTEAFGSGRDAGTARSAERGLKLAEGLYLNSAPLFQWPGPGREDFGDRGFCRGLRDQAAILVDGTVVPCCLDGDGIIRLGNLFEQDFGEIIGGDRAAAIHRGFSEGKVLERLCRNCGYRTRFS